MDTCVCVVEIYRLSLSFPRSLAHVDVLVHVRGRGAGMTTQGCGVWVTWDTYSKKLFRHVVHLGLPPAPAVRRTREPSLRAPEVRSTDAATVDSRTRQVTGAPPHLSYRPLPLRLATTTRRTRHSPSRICPFGRLVPFRAGCGPLAGPPRLVAAPTTVRTTLGQRTTRPAHESRQPAPPTGAASATPSFCTRHCGATTDALRSPLQPCPGRSRRVRAVRGPYCVLGDGR